MSPSTLSTFLSGEISAGVFIAESRPATIAGTTMAVTILTNAACFKKRKNYDNSRYSRRHPEFFRIERWGEISIGLGLIKNSENLGQAVKARKS